MGENSQYQVRIVEWRDASATLARLRTTVFVEEQGVPSSIEIDGRDGQCAHALAESAAGVPIGTGRLMPDGRIGRMAVLAGWRGKGVGAAILLALMAEAKRRGLHETYLHSQSHAQGFYARQGYVVDGPEYLEAGIPHVSMRARS